MPAGDPVGLVGTKPLKPVWVETRGLNRLSFAGTGAKGPRAPAYWGGEGADEI